MKISFTSLRALFRITSISVSMATTAISSFASDNGALSLGVSITPLKWIASELLSNSADQITVYLPKNRNPEFYEPTASQIVPLLSLDLYFSLNLPFEKNSIARLKSYNKDSTGGAEGKITVVNLTTPKATDFHLWTSPSEIIKISKLMLTSLKTLRPLRAAEFETNALAFEKRILDLDSKIKIILNKLGKNRFFLAYHPAWDAFAHHYDITQLSVETEGKTPTQKQLERLRSLVTKHGITQMLMPLQHDTPQARSIAKYLRVKITVIDPLDPNVEKMLLNTANTISTVRVLQ